MPRMPKQKPPGRSKQDYATPQSFIDALAVRYGGPCLFDLAASHSNAKAPFFFTEEDDALSKDWTKLGDHPSLGGKGFVFLNPPFARIEPWACKLANECARLPRWTNMLVPASVGSNWFQQNVHGKLRFEPIPRLTFVGETTPYPKDLGIVIAGYGMTGYGFFDWRLALAEGRLLSG